MYDIDLSEFVSDAATVTTAARATFRPSRYSIYLFSTFFSLVFIYNYTTRIIIKWCDIDGRSVRGISLGKQSEVRG